MTRSVRTTRRLALILPFAAALAACDSQPPTPTVADAQPSVPLAECPITVPSAPFVPSAPYLAQPPDYYKSVWYGTDALWTMLSPRGENWAELPRNGATVTQKTFWWSRNFSMSLEIQPGQPAIAVTGTRLDAPGSFTAGNPGTNASADFGTAMLVGIDIPGAGCWEIRAGYKGAALSYVVLVE